MRNLLIILLFILASCSQKPGTRTLEVTRASIAGSDLAGGVIVKLTNVTAGTSTIIELTTPPFQVVIPDGMWTFDLVGFIGPTSWSGTTHCGSTTLDLGPTTTSVDISLNALCTDEPYVTLIASKASNWDSGVWDQTKWAP